MRRRERFEPGEGIGNDGVGRKGMMMRGRVSNFIPLSKVRTVGWDGISVGRRWAW